MKILNLILIMILFTSSLALAITQGKVYDLTLSFKEGKIKNEGIFIAQGFLSSDRETSIKPFRLEIISFTNEILYERYFEFEFIASYHPLIFVEESRLKLTLPHFDNAKNMIIYQENSEILNIDVSAYSNKENLSNFNSKLSKFLEEDVSIFRSFSHDIFKKDKPILVNLKIENNCDCFTEGLLFESYPNYINVDFDFPKNVILEPLSHKEIQYSISLISYPKISKVKINPIIFKTTNNNIFISNTNYLKIENIINFGYMLAGILVTILTFIIYKIIKKKK